MKREFKLSDYQITLIGQEHSNQQYGFYIPELSLLFECYVDPPFSSRFILISHGHNIQCQNLNQRISGLPQTIICPKSIVETLNNYLEAQGIRSDLITFQGTLEGNQIDLDNPYFYLKCYNLDHTTACLGYGLFCRRRRPKQQLLKSMLNKQQIIEMRKQGIKLTEIHDEPVLIYLSDTTIKVFEQYPDILSYRYIVINCPYCVTQTKKSGIEQELAETEKQMSWKDLFPIIQSNPDCCFIIFQSPSKSQFWQSDGVEQKIKLDNVIFVH